MEIYISSLGMAPEVSTLSYRPVVIFGINNLLPIAPWLSCAWINIFQILLNQTEIRLYLPFSD